MTMIYILLYFLVTYGGRKRCWNNSGHCKKKCAADEVIRAVCKNRQSCCVSQLAVFVKETITSSPFTNGWEEKDMDRIVSVASTSTYLE
uniref:Beta-defensin n=1 Tax=Ovis aries TaxID=9940 RepID=A0A2V0A0C2_SHEEP|nr:TPA_exp: beta defensin OBD118 [Ovis aries]